MPWFRFTANFDWLPSARRHVAYPAGYEGPITTACAKRAEEAKAGEKIKRPPGMKVDKAGRPYADRSQ